MFRIGSVTIAAPSLLAPMAGVSDLPFRTICSDFGAGLVVGEMLTSDTRLWHSRKSQNRLKTNAKSKIHCIQIAGNNPTQMAAAASACESQGADIIDINMGCPAKKVCNKAAGSALLRDEKLVADILGHVVRAVNIPVTLKTRTGWSPEARNGVTIAKIAEDCGIQALTIHGRTRECRFQGTAEYDTIAEIAQHTSLPVIANGDINSAEKAAYVLNYTGAQAVMIGRAAQGNPWIFHEINEFLLNGRMPPKPNLEAIHSIIIQHLNELHAFYGDHLGTRIARKHIAWYVHKHFVKAPEGDQFRKHFNQLTTLQEQLNAVHSFFDRMHQLEDQAA